MTDIDMRMFGIKPGNHMLSKSDHASNSLAKNRPFSNIANHLANN